VSIRGQPLRCVTEISICDGCRSAAGWVDPASARLASLPGNTAASIEVRATEEIIAARAAQRALFTVEFVTAAWTPPPVFALDLTRITQLLMPTCPFPTALDNLLVKLPDLPPHQLQNLSPFGRETRR
jgi:hypothetical protein